MLYLINDILDFSQIESKNLVLNLEDTDIKQLIENCFSIIELKAEVKEIELCMKFSDDFPKKVCTDPNRLSQIIINLLSNAIKYTKEGFVKVKGSVDFNKH